MAATVLASLVAGCSPPAARAPRPIGDQVLGSLTAAALREVYGCPALVVRGTEGTRRAAIQDTDLAPTASVDDTNLVICVEGAGDTVEGFRTTARLLAESPHAFPAGGDALVLVLLKWSRSTNVVAEHMNKAAQEAGAALLAEMLDVHYRRHGQRGHVSVVAFSAGTRVVQMMLARAAPGKKGWSPESLAGVDNIVFIGSSIGSEEMLSAGPIRGRLVNFVNPRDTHFGDRAAYAAPAGALPDPLRLLHQATVQRRPRFGASVAGFRSLPTLTAAEQFDALDALASHADSPAARRAFKMINVPVPPTLIAYNLFGDPLPDDDLDDYLNQAPNHYILVGRGPGGRTDAVDFRQYRPVAEEFVREFVGAAALRGRLYRFDLQSVSKGANPLGLPLPVPWAVFGGTEQPAPVAPPKGPGVVPAPADPAKPGPEANPPGGPPGGR